MSATVARSAFKVDLLRLRRSASLWLLLLSAPIAARYMISETEGEGINLAVGGQLPVLTSPVFGIWLGIVVSLLVMPVAFIYLRAGPTRQQAWQIEEPTAASRVAIALGRYGAAATIMAGILAVLSIAGLFLAWLKVTGPFEPVTILALAWIVALPTLLTVAALQLLFDAIPWLRGALGDFLFFMLWMTAIIIPAATSEMPSTYANNLASVSGAIRPLVESAPPGSSSFAIGTSNLQPGRIELDPWRGVMADGYIAARFSWIILAIGIAGFAGLVYRPHKPRSTRDRLAFLRRFSLASVIPAPIPSSAPAATSAASPVALVGAQIRLIAGQHLFPILFIAAALSGLADDYRKIGSPAQLLLLVFALTALAGQVENRSMRALTALARHSDWMRRAAFVLAATLLGLAMAVPAVIANGDMGPLVLAALTSAVAGALAIGLAALSGSAFMPRIVMLIVWYAYFAG